MWDVKTWGYLETYRTLEANPSVRTDNPTFLQAMCSTCCLLAWLTLQP
jgi:hypothetical protein